VTSFPQDDPPPLARMVGTGGGTPDREPGGRPLKQAVLSATRWTALSFAVTAGAQFFQYVILARFLSPAEVGAITVVTLVASFADIFLSMGIAQAIIQRSGVSLAELQSLYWVNLLAGTVVTVAVASLASPIASFFGLSTFQSLVLLSAPIFVLSSHGQVFKASLEKALKFDRVARVEIASALSLVSATWILGLANVGAYSAVWGLICAAGVRALGFHLSARETFRPGLHFRFAETRRFLSFGLLQFLDSVLNYVTMNLTTIVTGRWVGGGAMGGFTLAFNTAVNTPAKINPVITRVMFPAFSLLQGDRQRMASNYLKVTTVTGVASIPALIGLILVREDFVGAVFGPTWSWIAPILVPLCVVGMFRAVGNPVGFLLMSTDRLAMGIGVNAVRTALTIPIVMLGAAQAGAVGAAYGLAAAQALGFVISVWVIQRVLPIRLASYLRACLTPVLLSVPLVLVVVGTGKLMGPAQSVLLQLLVEVMVGAGVFLVTVLLSRDPVLGEVRRALLSMGGARGADSVEVVVLLPVEERFDGRGGAVALWVKSVYGLADFPYRILAPRGRQSWAGRLLLDGSRLHDAAYAVMAVISRAVAFVIRRPSATVLSRLSLGGRLWVWVIAPKVRSAAVVHIHNRPSYAAWLRGYGYEGRIVLHMHNDLADYVRDQDAEARLQAVDSFWFCSDFLRARAQLRFGILDATTVYNGTNIVRREVPVETRRDGGAVALTFAGRLVPEKGALEAIEICRSLLRTGEYNLRLIGSVTGKGDGESSRYEKLLRARAAEVNAQAQREVVTFAGFLPHAELLRELASSQVFLYPCAWEEPFGMVVVEAMGCGVPVVASRRGGIPEIVEDGVTGHLVSGGVDAFVVAVRSLQDSAAWNAMSSAARTRAADLFDWPSIARNAFAQLRSVSSASTRSSSAQPS